MKVPKDKESTEKDEFKKTIPDASEKLETTVENEQKKTDERDDIIENTVNTESFEQKEVKVDEIE